MVGSLRNNRAQDSSVHKSSAQEISICQIDTVQTKRKKGILRYSCQMKQIQTVQNIRQESRIKKPFSLSINHLSACLFGILRNLIFKRWWSLFLLPSIQGHRFLYIPLLLFGRTKKSHDATDGKKRGKEKKKRNSGGESLIPLQRREGTRKEKRVQGKTNERFSRAPFQA